MLCPVSKVREQTRSACEAGESIEPGVERSGTLEVESTKIISPRKRAAERACSDRLYREIHSANSSVPAVTRFCGLGIFFLTRPWGSHAPEGFTLTPAPQANYQSRSVLSENSRDRTLVIIPTDRICDDTRLTQGKLSPSPRSRSRRETGRACSTRS